GQFGRRGGAGQGLQIASRQPAFRLEAAVQRPADGLEFRPAGRKDLFTVGRGKFGHDERTRAGRLRANLPGARGLSIFEYRPRVAPDCRKIRQRRYFSCKTYFNGNEALSRPESKCCTI